MAEFTPMMKQYFSVKEQNPGCIVFFRIGDFYEMFYDDAKLVSRELELVLTGKDCGQEERAPMCGIPFHSCESYIGRLVERGYRVAICEQTEDPAAAKGLVKRDVIRIITPGTVTESSMLDEGRNNYLCAVCLAAGAAGVCFADCSTGEIHLTHIDGDDVLLRVTNELGTFSPREILFNGSAAAEPLLTDFARLRLVANTDTADDAYFDEQEAQRTILRQFHASSPEELGLKDKAPAVRALGCVLRYLRDTQKTDLQTMDSLNLYSDEQFMKLDLSTRRNLELVETLRSKEKRGSLLGVLDRTKTAMGKRLIRSWITKPLIQLAPITRRQSAVGELLGDTVMRGDLMALLSGIYDLERIMTRIVYGSANARELRSLEQTIERIVPLKERLKAAKCALLGDLYRDIDPLEDVRELLDQSIEEDPPLSVREGGLIRAGYNAEIDELRTDMTDGKGIIARVEAQEKERTGIKTLKVGYNRVFGYYIEVTRQYSEVVPETYIRKQTLANAERFITQELKELEARVLGARDRVVALEYQLFCDIRNRVAEQLHRIQKTAQAIASLDVLCSFADAAMQYRYTCPTVDMRGTIEIKNGRHPVVEALADAPFVPNDTLLDSGENRVAIVTGPNMAGKSTYMRQTALIVLMAQIGSFVPADSATIGLADSIFTRVGASDDLASGQSTFMLEMSEVAFILKNATKDSLIVFDEIGRGTSTFDGMSIARAVLEFVADTRRVGARTMFATHYHEITAVENEIEGIKNYHIVAKKHGDDITFLRRIVRGPADDSYGIEVAKLAGVPGEVVTRARAILRSLEADDVVKPAATRHAREKAPDDGQLSLMTAPGNELIERLKVVDVNTLTPIEAMQLLFELNKEAKTY